MLCYDWSISRLPWQHIYMFYYYYYYSLTFNDTSNNGVQMRAAGSLRKAFTPDALRSNRSRDAIVMNPTELFEDTKIETSSPNITRAETMPIETTPPLMKEGSPISIGTSSKGSQNQLSATNDTLGISPAEKIEEDNKMEENEDKEEENVVMVAGKNDSVSTLKMSPVTTRVTTSIPEEQGEWSLGDINRNMSLAFRQELLSVIQIKTDSKVGLEVSKLSDPDLNVIELFGRCLPDIVPNVILAKREVS